MVCFISRRRQLNDISTQRQTRIRLASQRQYQAASPQQSVWVEASAGTGKTKVLSDRVLRLLLNGASPAHILCLTYTKAAASEMNNRIIDRLAKWASIDDRELSSQLSSLLDISSPSVELVEQARRLFAVLLDTPEGIKIQTIHSFCQEILKRFPIEAGISPYFSVIDDRETQEVLQKIKQDILSGHITTPAIRQALSYLTEHSSETAFPKILASITTNCSMLNNYFAAFPNIEAALQNINHQLHLTDDTSSETVIAAFWQNVSLDDFTTLIAALQAGTLVSQTNASLLASALRSRDFAAVTQVLLNKDHSLNQKLLVKKSIGKFPSAPEIYQNICSQLIDSLSRLRDIDLRDSTIAVLNLASELLSRYDHYKFIHSQLDYNDLIVKTDRLLANSSDAAWVLYKLDGGIDHILIDEAQDTSPQQWSIIRSLASEFFAGMGAKNSAPTIFAVGDRKQSIYSFQGADVAEFEKMHAHFAATAPQFQTINMEVSFRSTSAILDMVNTTFSRLPAACGVVATGDNIRHEPSRIGEGGHIEIWPVTYPLNDTTDDDVWYPPIERHPSQSASSLLAQKIAETIRSKVDSGERKANGEPLHYRDFLILVQRRNSFVEEMVRALKNAQVSVTGIDKINLNDQIAINDLLAAANFVLLPQNDLNLACLLKSPLFSLDDDDLFTLCYNRAPLTLWERLCSNPNYIATADQLRSLLKLGKQSRPFEFFNHILTAMNGRGKFVSRLSIECEDAIDEFINLTLSFEQDHTPSLQLFVDWMQSGDPEIKRNLEQTDFDAVRIMTVHASKGLQAPVVILPDTLRLKKLKQDARWLRDNSQIFYPLNKNYYNSACQTIQSSDQAASLEEYHRLLYVALTRAGEQLYICGYSNSNAPNDDSWYNLCRSALAQIASADEQGVIRYHINSLTPSLASQKKAPIEAPVTLPVWLKSPAPQESPLAKPLTPSHQDEAQQGASSPLSQTDSTRLYSRGLIIHKLLQFIPANSPDKREDAIRAYLKTQAAEFSAAEQDKIFTEVTALISSPQFAPLFSPSSVAEVSVMGLVDDRIISGQIDRLVITEDKVMIIDYKTNRPAASALNEVPTAYLKQMRAYRSLIARLYPTKQIETYILWTNTSHIMKID